jgi:antitoxin Phd
MRVYTYSEARQKLAEVLTQAESSGKVIIRRKDGRTFALVPEQLSASPLDVPSIKTDVSTNEIVAIVRESREKGKVR